jgi:hypothetical protein
MSVAVANVAAEVERFASAVFAPDDLVEIRYIKPSDDDEDTSREWRRAHELSIAQVITKAARMNAEGFGVYVGANPRSRRGGKAQDVALARCLFADFDGITLDAVHHRLDEVGLPIPTMTVASGGGVHVYWRLDEPITDLGRWSCLQRGIIDASGSDPVVKDPPRVMRLPGFVNTKPERNGATCRIIKCTPDRVFCLDEFPEPVEGVRPVSDNGQIPNGMRNSALTSIAGRLRNRGLGASEIATELREINRCRCRPPLDDGEVDAIARSIARYPVPKRINCTDYGNAQRFAAQHGEDVRFCPALGWHVWMGRHWRRDETGAIGRLCKATVRSIYEEAGREPNEARRKELASWARQSEAAARLRAMEELARTEPGIAIAATEFDRDLWAFTVLNGTIDLRTGELRPHRREDLITKCSPVRYDPSARSALWERFIRETTDGDDALATFLARAAGMSVAGDVREERLFFVHGPEASGKSTFVEAVKSACGPYAVTADFETFLHRSQVGGARNDIARLAGARLVASIEVDEGKRLAEGLLKSVTGGDSITCRYLYREAFTYTPAFTLWLVGRSGVVSSACHSRTPCHQRSAIRPSRRR